jgi:undecaprenyl diphosphate synthase
MQSNRHLKLNPRRLHVAIIMDGNGRWGSRQGLPRHAGHAAGVEAIGRVVQAAPGLGVGTLTLYAFSADNWRRPEVEVWAIMDLLLRYLESETARLVDSGIRLSVIGRRDRLPGAIPAAIARAEAETAGGSALHLRLAIDYSARDAILTAAAAAVGSGDLSRERFSRLLAGHDAPRDVDLLIRTSGEQRLSDFLLWECAYAELYFTDRLWPDFDAGDLADALGTFQLRQRRFGGLSPSVSAA